MADAKISALPAATALTGAELVPVVQGGQTVRATTSDIVNRNVNGQASFTQLALINPSGSGLVPFFTMASASDLLNTDATISVTGNGGHGFGQFLLLGDTICRRKFAANDATPQGKATVNAASVDLASVIALCNQLRAALIANGICQ